MAWYAEVKRRGTKYICHIKMCVWYSNKLYDEWYASLTEEQRIALEEEKKKKREEADKELAAVLRGLYLLPTLLLKAYLRR